MKAGWEVKAIASFAKTGAGGTPLKGKAEYYEGGQVPWLLSGEVCQRDITETKNFITDEGLQGSSAKVFPVGSVLIAMYGATAGQAGILRCEAATNQAVCAVLPNASYVTEYLYYFMLLEKENLVSQAVGNAQPNISQAKIKETLVPLPPLDEQKRIVEVLDAAFEGLSRARAHTEINLQNARELFESGLLEVFGNLNDPDDQKLLREVSVEFGRGKSKHRPRNDKALYDGAYPFIQTGDVRNSRHIIESYSQTYNEFGLAQSKLWPAGTVCITIAANIAETGVLGFDACFPDSVIGMVPDPTKTNSTYVEYLLQFFQKRLKALGEGSAQQNINLATFENEYFPFPALPIQEDAIERLSHLNAAVEDLESHYRAKLADLDALRQALLQKAFAGELT